MKLKRLILIAIIFSIVSGCGIHSRYRIIDDINIDKLEEIKIEEPLEKLQVGEKFIYKVEWMGLDVGIATLSIEGITERNGRKVYCILATVQSSAIISKLYKVEDEIYTYLDVENLYPVRFEKKQREGGYQSDEYIDFDQKKCRAFYFSRLNNSKKEYDIPENVHDPLSCIYYFRLQDVAVGKSIFANMYNDEKNYLLEAKIHKKGLINIAGVGEWEAFMVEPLPWFQGKITRKAQAIIWFSADEKRIPLLVTTKGIPFVGSVTISLQKIEKVNNSSAL